MDDHEKLWTTALHQALLLSVAAAIAECGRLRPGKEEEALACCRIAIDTALGSSVSATAEETKAFRATILDAVTTILDVAEEHARETLGLPTASTTFQ